MTRLPQIVGQTWFNSGTLGPSDLKGKVVLVDFWTYSCVNCQRTLPYLRQWWQKYQDMDFVLIGIHTPEFEFEKDPKNVEAAIQDLGITWPVVLDNNQVNWQNFANHYWPAKYLADKTGKIVYTHFGEGSAVETERVIQKLLQSQGGAKFPKLEEHEHSHGNVCFVPTPETYCGYSRGRLFNPEGYQTDQVANYEFPGLLPPNSLALSGKFFAASEYVESAEKGATIFLHFRATEVNLVMRPVEDSAIVEFFFNDQKVKDLNITKPTLYNFLKSQGLLEGILAVRAKVGNFQAYAFTFSGCT